MRFLQYIRIITSIYFFGFFRMFRSLLVFCLLLSSSAGKLKVSNINRRANVPIIVPIGKQIEYCQLLSSPAESNISIIAGLGPAGCGKTFFACRAAVDALSSGAVDRVVITRPIVAADEELGFLPGSIRDKMDPWVRPIMDILGGIYTANEIRRLLDEGTVEIAPLAYMRGRTFQRAFVIADEMQNSTPNQMLMMLTRIGEGSRMVITGDLMQSDLKCAGGLNGLADFHKRWSKHRDSHTDIRCVEFDIAEVKRSDAVASVLNLYSAAAVNKKTGFEDAALFPNGL